MKPKAALIVAALLAGCDEPTVITHVDRLSHMTLSDLKVIQGPQGIPVEMHGVPFDGAEPARLASALRPPSGGSQEIRFHPAAPGAWQQNGQKWRLVLHFNPEGNVPNAFHDCKLTDTARTASPPDHGFTVNAVFCNATEWQAHGYMKVLKLDPADEAAFTRVMRQLFVAIFQENTDPDR